jgi:DNA-binding NarL/FixJ family response regulator
MLLPIRAATPVGKRPGKSVKKLPRRPIVPISAVALDADKKRKMLADYIKLTAWWLGRPPLPKLPRRLEQVLRLLMQGCSEKQIARSLSVSAHTVHDYVKDLHKRLGVTSRGELLHRFLPRG